MYNKLEIAKTAYNAGIISKESYIVELWKVGMLVWDEAIDLIIRSNSDKRRGKH